LALSAESASTLYQSAQGLLSRYRACWKRGSRSRRGRRELRAGETVAAAAERLRAGGNRSRFRAGWCAGVKNSGPRRRKQRFAGGTRFLAPRRLARRDSRLKLGSSATCDGPRHSGSSPEGAKTHPRSLRSSSAVVHRCRYAPMVRRAESLKLPGDKTLAIAVAVSLVLFAWGLS
jgi:hypothetical protein